jgi:hypothetical protein
VAIAFVYFAKNLGHCSDVHCTTVPPWKAEVHPRSYNVPEVPKTAVSNRSKAHNLFDHLVGAGKQRDGHAGLMPIAMWRAATWTAMPQTSIPQESWSRR